MLTTHQPTQADFTRIPPVIPTGVDNGAGLGENRRFVQPGAM